MPQRIPKKKAILGATRSKSIAPKFFTQKGTNLEKAIATHKQVNQGSVQTAPTTDVGATGTTTGSSRPQAPDQTSVTRSVIAQRLGDNKSPRATEQNPPSPTYTPPGAAGGGRSSLFEQARRRLRGRGGFRG